MKEWLQSLQVLRAVAVISVVLFHFAGLPHGRAGVDLFFVISGFVMAGLMGQSPAKFARDRFIRIYPPFLAAMAVALLVLPLNVEPGKLVKSLLLWPFWREIYLYPAWSLSYEAMFYASLVLSMFVGGRAVLVVYALAFALNVPFFGSAFVLEFLAGFAMARKQWWALPVLALAAFSDQRVLMYGTGSAVIFWAALQKEQWFKHPRWEPVSMIGNASYSIYLTHAIIGTALMNHVPQAVTVLSCLAFGIGFHFAVEKPLLKLCRNGLRFRRAATQ